MSQSTMSNEMIMLISTIIMAPLIIAALRKWYKVNKANKEAAQVLNYKKAYYHVLTREKMEKCPREDLATAAIVHVLRKESEDYDHVYENLNHSERIIYIVYEIMNSLQKKDATMRTFFESDFYKPFYPLLDKAFYELGCIELGDLMKAARRLAEIIENDEDDDDDDPEMGDYSRYNFGDFTNEFRTLVISLGLNERLTDFIEKNKEDFIDEGIEDDFPADESLELEGEKDENISN